MNTVHDVEHPLIPARHPSAPKIGPEHHVNIEDAVYLAGLAHGVLYSVTHLDNRMKDLADAHDFRTGGPGPHGVRGDEPSSFYIYRATEDLAHVSTKLRRQADLADQAEKRFRDVVREVARRAYAAGCGVPEFHEADCQDEVESAIRDVLATRRAS